MSSEDADLVRMLNQIAAFHAPYPHDEAFASTRQHVKDFWEPRMRRALNALVEKGEAGLKPLALEVAQALAKEDASKAA